MKLKKPTFSDLIKDTFGYAVKSGFERGYFNVPDSLAGQSPTVITESRTKPFYCYDDFWKTPPVSYREYCETMIKRYPSEKQLWVAERIVHPNPHEWDTEYQKYVFAIGQGGGKNMFIISPIMGYLAYKIANMKDPIMYFQRFYPSKMPDDLKFEMCNSSMVSGSQAKSVHFENMKTIIKNTLTHEGDNWFAKHCGLDLRPQGIGDILSKMIEIQINPKNVIRIHSFDSTPTSPEGHTILLGVIDESSRADSQLSKADCDLLWKMYAGNINTRFGKCVGKAVAFSYLNMSAYDFTWEELKRTEKEIQEFGKSLTYAINLTSFETNPQISESDPTYIDAKRNDPADYNTRYLGIKGASSQAFYQPHIDAVGKCFDNDVQTPVEYHTEIVERGNNKYVRIIFDSIKGDHRMRAVAFDAGETGDSFVMKVGYIETMDEKRAELFAGDDKELIVVNKQPIVDVVLVWQPSEGITVDYLNVGDVLGCLMDAFPNLVSAKSDKWQSVKLIQEVIARGVRYQNIRGTATAGQGTQGDTLSFSAKMQLKLYTRMRWLVWSCIPKFYKDMHHTIRRKNQIYKVGELNQLEHEQLLRENNKIVHAPDSSKDLCDVDAILVSDLISLEVKGRIGVLDGSTIDDDKILNLAEKYIIIRQQLRNEGVNEHKQDTVMKIATEIGLNMKQIYKLKNYVEDIFKGT